MSSKFIFEALQINISVIKWYNNKWHFIWNKIIYIIKINKADTYYLEQQQTKYKINKKIELKIPIKK